jgi:hypothetical protein
MRTTILVASLILASTGCGVKRKPQPRINLFITPPQHAPYIDLHDPHVQNLI